MSKLSAIETRFDYSLVDTKTSDYLKQKELNIINIAGRAYTEMGKELKDAQDRLAGNNQYDGVFEKWFTSMGMKKQTVYNLINRYNLVVQNLDYQNKIEELPVSLTYEMAKPSANENANKKVLAGDISTLAEYKRLEIRARQAEEEKKLLAQEVDRLKKQGPKVVEIPTEKIPPDYHRLKDRQSYLEAQIDRLQGELKKQPDSNKLKEQINGLKQENKQLRAEMEKRADVKLENIKRVEFRQKLVGMFTYVAKTLKEAEMAIDYVEEQELYTQSERAIKELEQSIEVISGWIKYEGGEYIDGDYTVQS